MTVCALIDAWLAERGRAAVKPSSLRIYGLRLAPIRRTLGHCDINDLSRAQWLDALDAAGRARDGRPLANDTVALTITLVRALISFALEEELIAACPLKAKDFRKPAARPRERTATAAETERLLELMTPAYRRLYLAYRYTGARRAELTAARVEQIEGRRPARSIVLTEHKRDRSGKPRVIHLGREADALVTAAVGHRKNGHIFRDDAGRPWSPDRVTAIFARLRTLLGLPAELKLHGTRHEFATAMCQRHGLQAAAAACGHANLNTTSRYAHLSATHLRACATGLYDERPDAA